MSLLRRHCSGPSLRQRRRLAAAIELTLDRRAAIRRGLVTHPSIPHRNRDAVTDPLAACAALLRDRTRSWRRASAR